MTRRHGSSTISRSTRSSSSSSSRGRSSTQRRSRRRTRGNRRHWHVATAAHRSLRRARHDLHAALAVAVPAEHNRLAAVVLRHRRVPPPTRHVHDLAAHHPATGRSATGRSATGRISVGPGRTRGQQLVQLVVDARRQREHLGVGGRQAELAPAVRAHHVEASREGQQRRVPAARGNTGHRLGHLQLELPPHPPPPHPPALAATVTTARSLPTNVAAAAAFPLACRIRLCSWRGG